jgi:4-hydroxybenzoate polyprenyltransferase
MDLMISALAIVGIVIGGFCLNDFCDRHLDKSVHPERVIPTGRLRPLSVLWIAVIAFTASAILFSLEGIVGLIFWVVFVGLLVAYSPLKKQTGVAGNITMALLPSLVVVYGRMVVSPTTLDLPIVLLALAVFCTILSQEVVKDVEDMGKERGFRVTLPMIIGPQATFQLGAFLLAVALVLIGLFFYIDNRYVALAGASVAMVYGGFTAVRLLRAQPSEATSLVRMMKITMSVVVVVLIAIHF